MSNTEYFNSEAVYKEHIEPLVTQLGEMCQRYRLPFFVAVDINNSEDTHGIATQTFTPEDRSSTEMMLYHAIARDGIEKIEKVFLRSAMMRMVNGTIEEGEDGSI